MNSVFLRDSTAISDSILLLFGGCIKQGGLVCSFALLYGKSYFSDLKMYHCMKGGPDAVVRAVSLSHQVVGSKQPLRRFCGGKACLGFSLPQTPLIWEPLALGLAPYSNICFKLSYFYIQNFKIFKRP